MVFACIKLLLVLIHWIKFSSLSSKYNETETVQKWESFSKYEKDDSEMVDILQDFLSSTKPGATNDSEAAEIVIKEFPHFVNCCDVLYVFDTSTGLWSNNSSVV